jgi:hypothetical protein
VEGTSNLSFTLNKDGGILIKYTYTKAFHTWGESFKDNVYENGINLFF